MKTTLTLRRAALPSVARLCGLRFVLLAPLHLVMALVFAAALPVLVIYVAVEWVMRRVMPLWRVFAADMAHENAWIVFALLAVGLGFLVVR